MLPAASTTAPSLAAVLRSCLAAVAGEVDELGLSQGGHPPRGAVLLLVDGLGSAQLSARAGHARTLAGAFGKRDSISTVYPSTTAAALASLTTGSDPGQHGLVGYTVLDPEQDRVVNALTGWGDDLDPLTWQLRPTLFETATTPTVAVGPPKYRESGFTQAVLRGADYLAVKPVGARVAAAVAAAAQGAVAYVYIAELDQVGHGHGWQSADWTRSLEQVDQAVREVLGELDANRVGMVVTADHGMVDVPPHGHILFGQRPELVAGVRHFAGEPRNLHLHLEPDTDPAVVAAAWQASQGDAAWIATRDEAIGSGWFGTVDAAVRPRIGDVVVAARKAVAYYQHEHDGGRSMVGQHGSLAPEELRVPLLRFGAFARR